MLRLATAAVGALAYAFYKGSEEQGAYSKGLILTGNYAGVSAEQLGVMARQVGATVGTTGQAAEVLALLAGNGKIAGESFSGIAHPFKPVVDRDDCPVRPDSTEEWVMDDLLDSLGLPSRAPSTFPSGFSIEMSMRFVMALCYHRCRLLRAAEPDEHNASYGVADR